MIFNYHFLLFYSKILESKNFFNASKNFSYRRRKSHRLTHLEASNELKTMENMYSDKRKEEKGEGEDEDGVRTRVRVFVAET